MEEPPGCGYKYVHSYGRINPDATLTVFKKFPDIGSRNGKRIERAGPEYFAMVTVIPVQPVLGGDPDKPVATLKEVEYHALRQAFVDA